MLSISKAAANIGVAPVTLRRWEKKGLICPKRTPGNHRRYSMQQISAILNRNRNKEEKSGGTLSEKDNIKIAVYARVSQPIQKKNGDLERQVDVIRRKIAELGKEPEGIYTDVASGMNPNRKGLLKLFSDAAAGKFNYIYITHKDRLSRFCVEYLERHPGVFGVKVSYLNMNTEDTPQNELVRDMMAIIMSFSGKLHGLRAAKNREREIGLQVLILPAVFPLKILWQKI